MDLTNLKLFAMTAKRMDWLSKRQVVLSHNIANSDTGKYQPRDLKPLGFRDLLQRRTEQRGLQKTDAMHINATRVPEKYRPDSKKDAYETAPSGNAVIIEEAGGSPAGDEYLYQACRHAEDRAWSAAAMTPVRWP